MPVAEGLFVTAICMISVQYTSIRPINYPVNHETRVLLLHADVCVCVYVRVNSCSKLSGTIRSLPNCTKTLYVTGAVARVRTVRTVCASASVCTVYGHS